MGGANVWAESFTKTYSYGLSDWQLTNYEGKDAYYLVPNSGTESVATIPGIFQGKIINSDVVITINCATFGSGTNPKASTFTVFNSSDCGTAVKSTQSGQLPTSSTYTDVVYTIKSTDVSLLTNDLAIKITKPGRQIRLKSISVKFSFESNANSYSVAWNVNGKAYTEGTPTTKVYEGNKVTTLPTTPEDINGKIFVGWTNSEITAAQNDAPSVLFTDAADAPTVTGDVTYYAVFANKAGSEVTYTKLTSDQFKTDATYVIGAEQSATNKTMYFCDYEDNTSTNIDWGITTSTPSVVSPVTFTLSGSASALIAKDNNGNYLAPLSAKKFKMSSEEEKIGLSTEGSIQNPSNNSWKLRYNYNKGTGGFRWYNTDPSGTTLAYFYEVSGGYTYSGYCTTVEAAAEPTYTSKNLTLVAKDDERYYATFSSDKVTFFPIDQAMPYAITVANGKITDKSNMFEPKEASAGRISGYYIPANTGIMLYSTASNVNYYIVENYTVDALAEGANMLMPAPVAGGKFTADADKVYYKLAYGDWTNKTQLGFYWGADNGGAFYVKAGTAYLAVPKAKAAGAKGFTLNGEATGIEGVNANVENAKAIYNLNGQRVASMAKPGLYIVNGKKVVRK